MTNKEAICHLTKLYGNLEKFFSQMRYHLKEEYANAITLAISALEFRERYDKFWEEVKAEGTKEKETEIHHSGRVFRIREVSQ